MQDDTANGVANADDALMGSSADPSDPSTSTATPEGEGEYECTCPKCGETFTVSIAGNKDDENGKESVTASDDMPDGNSGDATDDYGSGMTPGYTFHGSR